MEILEKAKALFNTASEKTGDFVYSQKCNIKIARVCAELKKEYERLGRLTYRKLKGMKVDDEFDATVEKVEVLKMELAALREGKVQQPQFDSIVFEDGELVESDDN
jgi:hypothetical protein